MVFLGHITTDKVVVDHGIMVDSDTVVEDFTQPWWSVQSLLTVIIFIRVVVDRFTWSLLITLSHD